MKKSAYFFFLLVALAACSTDEVQKDLMNYVNNEIPKVSALETAAISAYDSVAGDHYQNDSIMYFTIKQNVIPKYEEFSSKLSSLTTSTPEVKAMNDEYGRI
jgi:hypothetical protein